MISKELLKFINEESEVLAKKYGKGYTKREVVMSKTIKLNEEVGELCSEILANFGNQRKRLEKDKHNKQAMEGEFADTLIVTLLLAKSLDVDINKSLKNKINKLKKRYEQEYRNKN